MSERPRDWIDQAGWAVTRALRWIGAAFITIALLGTAAAAIEGKWGLAGWLLLNALFQALAFAAAIAVGTWAFAPRQPQPSPSSSQPRSST